MTDIMTDTNALNSGLRILAVEASGPVAGCALWENGTLTAEYSVQ